jgi:hypothetical protein
MCSGKWVVSFQWVVDSMQAGVWLDEELYEVQGDAKCTTLVPGGPKRARLAFANKTGGVFSGIKIYIGKKKLNPNNKEYIYLLRCADGSVYEQLEHSLVHLTKKCATSEEALKREQATQHILICDRVDRRAKELIEQGVLTAVTEEWASDSLSNFYLMGLESYKVQLRRRGR